MCPGVVDPDEAKLCRGLRGWSMLQPLRNLLSYLLGSLEQPGPSERRYICYEGFFALGVSLRALWAMCEFWAGSRNEDSRELVSVGQSKDGVEYLKL